jgi:ferredoxin
MDDTLTSSAQNDQKQVRDDTDQSADGGGGKQKGDDGKLRTKTLDKAKYIIKIDVPACIGAASCVAIAPKVFALDDQQKAKILDPAGDTPDNILMAAQSCPTKAIILVDRETGKQVWPEA